VGNRVRYRFSIGRGAFHASYRQGVDVERVAGSKASLGWAKIPLTRCRKSSGDNLPILDAIIKDTDTRER
jgi:hypothetical protein